MAKYKHTKVTTDKITMEGILDAATMTVDVEGDKISIADELVAFDGRTVSIAFTEKTEEDVTSSSDE